MAGQRKDKEKLKPPVKVRVQIRFDPGDYELLQEIAHEKGTKAAALVRGAVKEIIRKNTGKRG